MCGQHNNNLCTGRLGVMIAKHVEDPSRRIYEECPGRGQSSEAYLRKAVVFYFDLFDGEKNHPDSSESAQRFCLLAEH